MMGQFYIVNLGGTRAIVKEILYEFYVSRTLTLPAKRPWEGKSGKGCEVVLIRVIPIHIRLGERNPFPRLMPFAFTPRKATCISWGG